MSHHRDIGNAYAKLEGEGWHIEYHFEAEYKSAKRRRCQKRFYFNHCVCNYAHISCMGVTEIHIMKNVPNDNWEDNKWVEKPQNQFCPVMK